MRPCVGERSNDIVILIDKTATLQNLVKIQQALKLYRVLLKTEPANHIALLNKGNTLHATGFYQKEIQYCDVVLDADKMRNGLYIQGTFIRRVWRYGIHYSILKKHS